MIEDKCCSVYHREGQYYIVVKSAIGMFGPWIADGAPVVFSDEVHAQEIGTRVLQALNASRVGLDESTADASLALFEIAKVKNWKNFELPDTNMVSISQTPDKTVEIVPTKNERLSNTKKGGFSFFKEDDWVVVHSESELEIGKAVLEAFKRCEEQKEG